MDVAAQYRYLMALGRDEFLAMAAPAALVRYRRDDQDVDLNGPGTGTITLTLDGDEAADEPLPPPKLGQHDPRFELYPLAKKPGASFPDRITIGRTSNNDVAIADQSVSRLHAYVRAEGDTWIVADAGSKNGSWLHGEALLPRRETKLASRSTLRLGDVELAFFTAEDLFTALGRS